MRYDEILTPEPGEQQCLSQTPTNGISASHNNSYIELVCLAYYVYHKVGLSKDQQQFSTRVLGKSASYLSCMKARKRKPTQLVLNRLLRDVRLQRGGLESNRHFGMPYAESLNRSHKELQALARAMEEVLVEPTERALLADEFDAD